MGLPESSRLTFTPDLTICRVLNGMWQVSGAHGRIDPTRAIESMIRYADAGFTTWDLADHYGPAEDFIGEFRQRLATERGEASLAHIQAFTKWVPRPGPMTRQIVEENVDISRRRMGVETLDLLQFHWWDYGDDRYLDALQHLTDLKAAGKIKHLALTNFDTEHLEIICDRAIPIVSNQVQFSLVDRRPLERMAAFCQERDIHLLAYGTLGGGLLSERYLGQREPGRWALGTASLQKYKRMVEAWGGWGLLQELLAVLNAIAQQHQVSIANVAVRYVLDQPAVAGAIVGVRLGQSEHLEETAQVFSFTLSPEDLAAIEAVLGRSQNLYSRIGDCGDEYRR
ncbi:MAG: aldo/keto reductase [Elainellaceae cyanobacterium]